MHQSAIRAAVLAVTFAAACAAHDIPAGATVRILIEPTGSRLEMLVRVPLAAIRDVDFPVQGPGYLDLEKLAPLLPDAASLWIASFVDLRENGTRLAKPQLEALRISLPSDRSFASIEQARRHFDDPPLTNGSNVLASQVFLDAAYRYAIGSDRSAFAIRPGLAHLAARVTTVLLYYPPGGAVRAYEFEGDPGLAPLDPGWTQAARRFVEMGFFHILDGADHLLFLACLVIPIRRLAPLAWIVTAFTVAHSITLIASAYGYAPGALWFPAFIEALIAASIVFMAIENIVAPSSRRRWVYAFGFGLVHGFGFSFALRETLQFAGSHLLTALLSFNLGVELGQLTALAVFVPLLAALFRYAVEPRLGTIILSALLAHSAWHWMTERAEQLSQYTFRAPDLDAAFLAPAMRWVAAGLVVGAIVRWWTKPK
ncbi:MAG: HupE/UreJ family protein [Bryobacteraceae bacterium]